jgi:hypothetical protein
VPYDKEFVFRDGKRARNIAELCHAIEYMSDDEFSSFVDGYKNDFANWVEFVLSDKRFADALRLTVSRDNTLSLFKQKVREILNEDHSVNMPIQDSIKDYARAPMGFKQGYPPEHEHTREKEMKESKENREIKDVKEMKESTRDTSASISVMKQHPTVITVEKAATKHHDGPEHDEAHHSEESTRIPPSIGRHTRSKWYEFFKTEHTGRKSSLRRTDDGKISSTHKGSDLPDNQDENNNKGSSENVFWAVLYWLLIILIVGLIVYKFILNP